tara:strand:- start:66 stop:299 length:234 start_codon:yes stop_codon:yes gene_type:complete
MNNELRAELAFDALKATNKNIRYSVVGQKNPADEEVVGDLLCNLMHLLDNPDLGFFHLSFSQQLEQAYLQYEEEIKS